MKKVIFGMIALSFALASCGGAAKSDAELLEEAKKQFSEKQAELDTEATKKCDEFKSTEVPRLVDSLKAANAPQEGK